jgi:hypothetical protein
MEWHSALPMFYDTLLLKNRSDCCRSALHGDGAFSGARALFWRAPRAALPPGKRRDFSTIAARFGTVMTPPEADQGSAPALRRAYLVHTGAHREAV